MPTSTPTWMIHLTDIKWASNNTDLPNEEVLSRKQEHIKPRISSAKPYVTKALEKIYNTKVLDFNAKAVTEEEYWEYVVNMQKTLTILIPRNGLSNDIVFKHDEQLREILNKIGCKWWDAGMFLTEGEGYRDMTFDVDDNFNENLVADAIKEYNKENNIEIEFHFYDPKQIFISD